MGEERKNENGKRPFWMRWVEAGLRFVIQALLNGSKRGQKTSGKVDNRETAVLLAEGEKLRDQAHMEAQKRNDCFEQSQNAYQSGDGGKAKELSNQGKVHDANMKRFNAEAANLIFQAKQREVDPNELDLHGLYVNEAVEYTKDRFTADRAGGKKDLIIIYGAGNHSAGGIQKIKPAIIDLLNERNMKYTDLEPNHGCVTVHY